jgi:hypothetical protein
MAEGFTHEDYDIPRIVSRKNEPNKLYKVKDLLGFELEIGNVTFSTYKFTYVKDDGWTHI